MLKHIKAVNQHAVKVSVPDLPSITLPACNIALDQADHEYTSYFEFGLMNVTNGFKTYSHYTFSVDRKGLIEVIRSDAGYPNRLTLEFVDEMDFRGWLIDKQAFGSKPYPNPGKAYEEYIR